LKRNENKQKNHLTVNTAIFSKYLFAYKLYVRSKTVDFQDSIYYIG
jgi:hypothetical protein